MIDVTNGTNVDVRLASVKLFLCGVSDSKGLKRCRQVVVSAMAQSLNSGNHGDALIVL
ncbi:hypothetical protein D3C86_2201540 [compost metagenome]